MSDSIGKRYDMIDQKLGDSEQLCKHQNELIWE